jgi:hypothetical protein
MPPTDHFHWESMPRITQYCFSRYSIGHADEVLRALEGAQTGPAKIDDEEPEDIEKYRQKVKDGD